MLVKKAALLKKSWRPVPALHKLISVSWNMAMQILLSVRFNDWQMVWAEN